MKRFRVLLKGHNYLLPYDGEPRKMGFTAVRVVRADTPEEAERLARAGIVCDSRLVRDLLNGSQDPATLEVESIRKLGLFGRDASPTLDFFFEDLAEESPADPEQP